MAIYQNLSFLFIDNPIKSESATPGMKTISAAHVTKKNCYPVYVSNFHKSIRQTIGKWIKHMGGNITDEGTKNNKYMQRHSISIVIREIKIQTIQ